MKIKYLTRCQIVDVNGKSWHGIEMITPNKSYPHIGKLGIAEGVDDIFVRISLDDGNIIWGHECWWKPIKSEEDLQNENNKKS